jgi:hypothetical protein
MTRFIDILLYNIILKHPQVQLNLSTKQTIKSGS